MIQVDLAAPEVQLDPGGTAQLTFTVKNCTDSADHVAVEIDGIDMEWYALPVSSVPLEPGQQQSARVLFKIGRSTESASGTYPFVVRARSMESGTVSTQQANLVVRPFCNLQVTLEPKQARSTFIRGTVYLEVAVANMGNRDETVDLTAVDPDGAWVYQFNSERITVARGHSETVELSATPVRRSPIANGRSFNFTVTARSVQDAFVQATVQGQLERRALISPLTVAAVGLTALGVTAWAFFHPRPVNVTAFTATPMAVRSGDEVTLAWDTRDLQEGFIRPDNIKVTEAVGSMRVRPLTTTAYSFVARGGGNQVVRTLTVMVAPRPTPAKPRITGFTADKTVIHQGDQVTLSWTVLGADTVVLNPLGTERDVRLYHSQVVSPTSPTTYVLSAKGPGGFAAEKTIKVQVVAPDVSIASISYFRAQPSSIIQGSSTTLSWSTDSATTVGLDNGLGDGKDPHGKFVVSPTETTTYTLKASDDKGNLRTAQVTVTVRPRPAPVVAPTPKGPGPVDTMPPPAGEGGAPTQPGQPVPHAPSSTDY